MIEQHSCHVESRIIHAGVPQELRQLKLAEWGHGGAGVCDLQHPALPDGHPPISLIPIAPVGDGEALATQTTAVTMLRSRGYESEPCSCCEARRQRRHVPFIDASTGCRRYRTVHMARYPAQYTDQHGTEQTHIDNDGDTLRMTLRGVEFSGSMFDDFEHNAATTKDQLSSFTFYGRALCACTLEWDMPISVNTPQGLTLGALSTRLELGAPLANRLERQTVQLTLRFNGQTVNSAQRADFEYALVDIQKNLTPDVWMVNCFGCAFSDYNPIGAGNFGCLACFRDCKDAYRAIGGKAELFALWDSRTEFVQETHVCAQFERRKPGTGYRG